MFLVSLKNPEGVLSGTSAASSEKSNLPSNKKTAETLNIKYPVRYLRDLGKCIIEILSGISLMEHDLLSPFIVEFKENCLGMLQQTEKNKERSTESVEQVIYFILLLDEYAVHRGEKWPLVDLVGPMLAQSFPLITSLVSYY